MSKIGAHVSAAVSLERSFDKALEIGAKCTQIFISPPRQWSQTDHSQEEIERYVRKLKETGIWPNFIHGTYLINLGAKDPVHLQKSVDWLIYALNTAEFLQVEGVIFHLGSHKGAGFDSVLNQVVLALKEILQRSSRIRNKNVRIEPLLILETAAGAGNVIGDKFSELGQILKGVNNPRLKICLDTQHVFASGYDLKTQKGLANLISEFEKEIGLENLVAIHANDSKTGLGSHKDRHENIGSGLIGKEGFSGILNHPKLKNLPFILEVPGFTDSGPDSENISILKSLVK